jgi:CHASE2 domain-containing sensor protein
LLHGATVVKERLKKTAVSTIFAALVRFFIDAPFLRSLELKALDRLMVSRGTIPTRGETLQTGLPSERRGNLMQCL